MTKNPIINAFGALGYIVLIVTVMNYIMETQGSKPDPAYAPVIFISTLSLSVAVMAYVFFYNPLTLLIDGKKKEAADLLLKTIGVFAAITVVVAILIFSGVLN